jgi:hypothetical protein
MWPRFKDEDPSIVTKKLNIKAAIDALLADVRAQRLHFTTLDFSAFVALTYRKWFHRVWIVQEFCISKNPHFVVGSRSIPGDSFMAAFQLLNLWIFSELKPLARRPLWISLPTFVISCGLRNGFPFLRFLFLAIFAPRSIPSARAAVTLGTRKRVREDIDLKGLLVRAFLPINGGTLEASFSKDCVYAMLGIAADYHALKVPCHYENKTYQEVYVDLARRLLHHGHLDILSICRPPFGHPPRDPALPSWTPDWSKPLRTAWGQFSEDSLFEASKNEPSLSAPSRNAASSTHSSFPLPFSSSPTIPLKAYFIGKINLLPQASASHSTSQAPSHIHTIQDIADLLATTSAYTNKQRSEGLWRIPVADRELNDVGQIVKATPKSSWDYTWITFAARAPWLAPLLPGAQVYHDRMADLADGMPCSTDTKYVGICPNNTLQGDQVWLPSGAHVPYVFRPLSNSAYQLVGEAFIYGIMHGELFKLNPRSQVLTIE